MATREQRIKVFEDTQEWIRTDKDLWDSVAIAKLNTKIFWEDEYPAFRQSVEYDTKVTVSARRSFEAAARRHWKYPVDRIAVLNFANAFTPGGGVTRGSGAQEESLCRTSTLYPLINRRSMRDSFYKFHQDMNTPKASDALIYTSGVVICKTDEDLPQRLPREQWVEVDVITMAAPDLRSRSNIQLKLTAGGACMNDAELFGYHVKRAIHMLTCAAAQGVDTLILGAFGCGAFQNDPEIVARAYRTALEIFPRVFKRIEFAVYCGPEDDTNYQAFRKVFQPR